MGTSLSTLEYLVMGFLLTARELTSYNTFPTIHLTQEQVDGLLENANIDPVFTYEEPAP